jgi:hypothetical protein
MIDQMAHVTGVVKGELGKLTMGKESTGCAVGYSFGTVPVDKEGQVYIGPLWMVLVSMRHPLIGYDDIALSLPVLGVLPSDSVFRQMTGRLLGECRKARDEALKIDAKAMAA